MKLCREKEHLLGDHSINEISPTNERLKQFLNEWQTIEYPQFKAFSGGNDSTEVILFKANSPTYLIPPKCKFFHTDIKRFSEDDNTAKPFDLIILDPPWWNKYVRRSRNIQRTNG